ncbi:MAG: arginine--tRNA ligase [Defluviitoga tunisiensis]|jgi:arginyl-tRNA synthetase|uniref:Arginine--tRNA ligase n=1 Tax=Defluviitoga tunisiensis TaxID=1006576 RepID=A0A0C7P2L5_DEFTU|nr:arginine--tRNA ligase [Defluviitoga tunisiensis]MDD3601098.1 arginine--tRNA ligase [Defluviitoga tunisiensis]MDY0379590.1 arginine--tRNA ligase [Defluviitoga tunisiensis]CEP78570.1 Arginine-tRNA ligase [Defluviitoga tunisiensis]HOB55052.1 arginine--tRNA ligase [Defluviitoga tunisiensis]HOK15733.1 arginine--tRNA ligase [Defluviitoga tunisiensis]
MEIISLIKEQIDNALKELGLANFSEEYVVEIPPQDDLGDFSSNISFLLAKKFKKNPKVISQELSEKLSKNNFFTKVENVNGFLNLFLSPSVYQRICSHIISHPRNYGKIDIGKGKIIQFEFASVNPTGPLTIAHGRQAVMGDVIGNIYEQTGHIVQKEMYLNDAGRQIKLLARSLWVRYNELLGSHYEIPEDGYVGEYLIETARTLINKYGDLYKDKWNSEIENLFMEEAVEDMLNKMLYTLKQLDIYFDIVFSEKLLFKNNIVNSTLNQLKSKGFVYEKDGALWFKVSDLIEENDKVLIRSNDNMPTYFCDDIAYHYYKYLRGFDQVIDILGSDHHGHIPRMMASIKALGLPEDFLKIILHQFVNIKKDDELIRMSTRRGEFYTLDELINKVGKDAVRYFFAMVDPDTTLNFDVDLAIKKSNENPVFYVQYAHARICSIFKEAEKRGIKYERFLGLSNLDKYEEKALLRELALFPNSLVNASLQFKPNLLTQYLEKVSSRFHHFYNSLSVLNADNYDLMQARLNLCEATKIVLNRGLSILGVSAPESM